MRGYVKGDVNVTDEMKQKGFLKHEWFWSEEAYRHRYTNQKQIKWYNRNYIILSFASTWTKKIWWIGNAESCFKIKRFKKCREEEYSFVDFLKVFLRIQSVLLWYRFLKKKFISVHSFPQSLNETKHMQVQHTAGFRSSSEKIIQVSLSHRSLVSRIRNYSNGKSSLRK